MFFFIAFLIQALEIAISMSIAVCGFIITLIFTFPKLFFSIIGIAALAYCIAISPLLIEVYRSRNTTSAPVQSSVVQASVVQSDTPTTADCGTARVFTEGQVKLRLRDEPGSSSNVIDKLPYDTVVTRTCGVQNVDGQEWVEIQCFKKTGWVIREGLR